MCNLNIYVKKSNDDSKYLRGFIMATTSNSYARNSDGEGFYFSNGILVKSKAKINIMRYQKSVLESKFIISHQRLATSGFSSENIHPFANDDFVLAHNGVMSEFVLEKDKSDTHGLFTTFCENFSHVKDGDRTQRIIKAIKLTLDEKEGSYSVALFDKRQQELYYFKNSSTTIVVHRIGGMVYITTSEANQAFFSMLKTRKNPKEIKLGEYCIYKITSEDRLAVCNIGKIKKPEEYAYPKRSWDNSRWEYCDYGAPRAERESVDWERIFTHKKKNTAKYARVVRENYSSEGCFFCGAKVICEEERMDMPICDTCIRNSEDEKMGITCSREDEKCLKTSEEL